MGQVIPSYQNRQISALDETADAPQSCLFISVLSILISLLHIQVPNNPLTVPSQVARGCSLGGSLFSQGIMHILKWHSIFVHFRSFSFIFVHFRSFSFIFVHFRSFSFIFVHFLSFSFISFIFFHFLSVSFSFLHFLSFSFIFFISSCFFFSGARNPFFASIPSRFPIEALM